MDINLFFLIISIIFLAAVLFLIFIIQKSQKRTDLLTHDFLEKEKKLDHMRIQAEKQALVADERYSLLKSDADSQKAELLKTREENLILTGRLEKAKAEYFNLQDKLQTQKDELEEIQKKFTTELTHHYRFKSFTHLLRTCCECGL